MRAPFKSAVFMAALLAGPGLSPAAAAAASLLPHRAVYDLRLADQQPQGGSEGMAAVGGRMVFEFTGTPCEGYTVNFRFVVEMTDGEGSTTVTDLRTSTFESGAGDSFDFLSQTFTNQVLTDEVKGAAVRGDSGVSVDLVSPAEAKVAFKPEVIFPTEHLLKVIAAAEKGDTVLAGEVFDGSETGDKTYATSTIIGEPISGAPEGPAASVGTTRRWPVTVAYFDASQGGDLTPEYSIGFDLFDNGVSADLRMDYGEFALQGDLTHFEALPTTPCE